MRFNIPTAIFRRVFITVSVVVLLLLVGVVVFILTKKVVPKDSTSQNPSVVISETPPETPTSTLVASPFKTEIIVRTVNNLRDHSEVVSFLNMATRYHVSVINLAVKQDEDDEMPSGVVFYDSAIAPRAPGYETFDVLRDVIIEAHQRGIKIRAWVPQFHDQVAARKYPEWQMQVYDGARVVPFSGADGKEYFVNPLNPAVQSYQHSIIEEIARNYDVDGIVLDWLRFDDYNMDMGSDTREKFQNAFGHDPINIDFSTDNTQRTQWNTWRSTQIGAYVQSVRQKVHEINPEIDLGVYILSPEFSELGQDASRFSEQVNFLSPMAYFDDWGYARDWIYRTVLPLTEEKANGVAVVPVFDVDWDDATYREILPKIRQGFPSITTLSWFMYGAWTEAILQRIDTLRSW